MFESEDPQSQAETLFVVIDPVQDNHLALERAVITARFRQPVAHVHLHISVDMDHIDTSADNAALYRDCQWFNELVVPLQEANISYSTEVSWSSDWYVAIIKAAQRVSANLILLPMMRQLKHRERYFNDSIWRLLRSSPCPVLVMRADAEPARKIILAAVNFQSHKPEYEKLNQAVIDRGHWYAEKYQAELHVVNAYDHSLQYPDRTKLAVQARVPTSNIHVRSGKASEVIAQVASEISADVTLVGVRERFKRWRGNTSGNVILRLEGDLLVINSGFA